MKFKFYFLAIFCSLITGTCLNAVELKNSKASIQREKDLKVILDQTFLREGRFDKMAAMYIAQATDENQLPVELVVSHLRQAIQTKDSLQQLMEPYHQFTNEEIHQLRQIFENEAFLKYMDQSFSIAKSNMQVMDHLLNTVIQQEMNGMDEPSSKGIEIIDKENKVESDEIVVITKDNYHEEVEESTKPVIVDVYAEWCRPCRTFSATFEELHEKYKNECRFGKVNSQEESLLVTYLKVSAYPTTVFIHNGKVITREVGNMSKKEFEAKIQDFLKDLD